MELVRRYKQLENEKEIFALIGLEPPTSLLKELAQVAMEILENNLTKELFSNASNI